MVVRVDWRVSLGYAATVLRWIAGCLLLPLFVALLTGADVLAFSVTAVVALTGSFLLDAVGEDGDLGGREAVLLVSLVWVLAGLVGALPYVLAGDGTVATPANAVFESVSGFTTTGATVMADVSLAAHSRAVMLWRQETQWLGGMGIVVLAVALFERLSVGGFHLVEAESPGPELHKLTPTITETARTLWRVYALVTAVELALLYALHLAGLAPKMTFYMALSHAFSTLATGGFSPAAQSVAAFSAAVQWVIIPFMVVAGVNFALLAEALGGDTDSLRADPETRVYLGVLAALGALLFGALAVGGQYPLLGSLRHAVFQAVSIVTTTGYASVDFNTWSDALQTLLVAAMFIGGSAGSTGSAVKIIRWVVIAKSVRRALFTTAHPAALRSIRVGGEVVDDSTVRDIHAFTLLYLGLFAVGTLAVLAAGTAGAGTLTTQEAMSAVAATLGNVGPGVDVVGPMNNYLVLPLGSKLLLCAYMVLGRLEILTVLVLLTREFWRV
ncbi:TrkH family potassium uptake protein [Halarchaeum sp. P4]|uniref:TrkH family potassium uptake protein n=1 Tax=Halarchaeum sp. P4 TaxID=3421639 RepID=UPI003EBBF7A1